MCAKRVDTVVVGAGQTTKVTLAIPIKELAFYNVETSKWEVEAGKYDFKIGNSSRNIQGEFSINVK